jgi:hypothetical protein
MVRGLCMALLFSVTSENAWTRWVLVTGLRKGLNVPSVWPGHHRTGSSARTLRQKCSGSMVD